MEAMMVGRGKKIEIETKKIEKLWMQQNANFYENIFILLDSSLDACK